MARKVHVVDNDIMPKKLHEHIKCNGHKKWFLLAFILLLIVLTTITVPVVLTIIQSRRRHSNGNESEVTENGIDITKTMSTETIILAITTAEGKKEKENWTQGISYKDKVLGIVGKLIEGNANPCATYVIEEFSDKTTFSKLLSKTEVICELERIFHDIKSSRDISITNAIDSFRKIPWSSQITYILFVPDEAMYRNRKMYKNDMKSAKGLLKRMITENPITAPCIIIGNPAYFRQLDSTVNTYSSDMNVDELTKAILLALRTEEFVTSENLFTSPTSTNKNGTAPSRISETPSTNSWIRETIHEEQMSTLGVENNDSITISPDLPVTVTELIKCPEYL